MTYEDLESACVPNIFMRVTVGDLIHAVRIKNIEGIIPSLFERRKIETL